MIADVDLEEELVDELNTGFDRRVDDELEKEEMIVEDADVEELVDVDGLDGTGAPEIARATYPAYTRVPLSVPGVYTRFVIADSRKQLGCPGVKTST